MNQFLVKFKKQIILIPIHSLVLSIYPIIFLLARNVHIIKPEESIRSLILSLAISLILLIGFQYILKEWNKGGTITSLLFVQFYSLGHIVNLLEKWTSKQGCDFNVLSFTWLWICTFLLLTYLIIRINLSRNFTLYLNAASMILITLPILTILFSFLSSNYVDETEWEILSKMRNQNDAEKTMPHLKKEQKPDIYLIIFDGYVRSDKLSELYGYDNTYLIDGLKDRKFYIADYSRSNYLTTFYSLNTSLNMIYFHEYPQKIFLKYKYNLKNNYVYEFLHRMNYQTVVFQSGSGDTNSLEPDILVSPNPLVNGKTPVINSFERLLIRSTFGFLLLIQNSDNLPLGNDRNIIISSENQDLIVRRELINNAFAHLSDFAIDDRNYFLIAHIHLPHIPFLFGPDGEPLNVQKNSKINWYFPEPANYIELYTYQIDYLNKSVLSAIDRVLEKTTKPVVIILMSDHGDDKYLDWDSPSKVGVDVRSAILNAIYFSDKDYIDLYPSLTPVNTFRIIFNHVFGTTYPLLLDKVFTHEHPLNTQSNVKPDFIDACIVYDICLPDVRKIP